jgi:hypothetical protein
MKLWYDWDWRGSEQEFRRSLELNPNDSVTHREYSHFLQLQKRFDEALEEKASYRPCSPRYPSVDPSDGCTLTPATESKPSSKASMCMRWTRHLTAHIS